MSTLKVNKLRDTAGSADAITLDPNGGAVIAGVTTISTARVTSGIVTNTFIVGAGVTISESGIEASGIGITCASINGTQIGGRRNIYINGAMTVAQRGTSSTEQGYKTVDRIRSLCSNNDEVATQAQVDVASGTTPYSLGFRKAFKLTNGNQTSGANADDVVRMQSRLESQDIANSGWNYKSSSSYLTLSFWCKSSVAQNFYVQLVSYDGSAYSYTFETGSLTADTWTKVVHSVPGNSNLQFDNDANLGLDMYWIQYYGTDNTASDHSLNSWAAYASGSKSPDMTTTWFTTNDATWEMTGVQLEVGPQATAFEHRSFGEELQLCARYFQQFEGGSNSLFATGFTATNDFYGGGTLPMGKMRAAPTIAVDGTLSHLNYTHVAVARDASSITNQGSGDSSFVLRLQSTSTTTDNAGAYARITNSSTNLTFDAEL